MAAKKSPASLPDHVDVMGVRFRVQWGVECEEGARGDFDGDSRTIRILPHADVVQPMGSSFLHEALHAALYASGLDEILDRKEPGLDETVVRPLEGALYPLLKLLASIPAK